MKNMIASLVVNTISYILAFAIAIYMIVVLAFIIIGVAMFSGEALGAFWTSMLVWIAGFVALAVTTGFWFMLDSILTQLKRINR